jgi:site-specific DNA-methyltransferase (adenine-specific)
MFPARRLANEYGETTGKSLSKPIIFMLYTKDRQKRLIGMRLYNETNSIRELPQGVQRLLIHCPQGARSTWKKTIHNAIEQLGGKARLEAIYDCLSNRKPTANPWWKEKVRQVCQQHFIRVEPATYALPT